jgi:hypothetical protein
MRTLVAVEGTGKVNKAGVVAVRVADLDEKGLYDLMESNAGVKVDFPNRETVTGRIVSAWPFADGAHLKLKPNKVKKAQTFDAALSAALGTPQRPQPDLSGLSLTMP